MSQTSSPTFQKLQDTIDQMSPQELLVWAKYLWKVIWSVDDKNPLVGPLLVKVRNYTENVYGRKTGLGGFLVFSGCKSPLKKK